MKPATPLPWVYPRSTFPFEIFGVNATNQKLVDVGNIWDADDAAYVFHAANAYPRLVEALKARVGATGETEEQALGHALALLRELGELI